MNNSLYDKLGVNVNSSPEEIKQAYKDKAKEHHPDKKGGDSKDMAEINHAYMILRDPVKRKRYDETGEDKDVPFDVKFNDLVNIIFIKICEMEDEKTADLVTIFKKQCRLHKQDLMKAKGKVDGKLGKLMVVLERLSGSDERIKKGVRGNIDYLKGESMKFKSEIQFLDEAMEVIDKYEYKVDDIPEPRFVTNWYISNSQGA